MTPLRMIVPRRIRKKVIPVVIVTSPKMMIGLIDCKRNDTIDESAYLTIRATTKITTTLLTNKKQVVENVFSTTELIAIHKGLHHGLPFLYKTHCFLNWTSSLCLLFFIIRGVIITAKSQW